MKTINTRPSPLKQAIEKYERTAEMKFRPTRQFYNRLGINRIRFWQLVKGSKEPLVSEAKCLSAFFEIPVEEFFKQESPIATANSVGLNAVA